MSCYVIEDTVIDCRNRSFELCANHESAFGFLYFIHSLQEMPEETLKHDHGNLLLKLNWYTQEPAHRFLFIAALFIITKTWKQPRYPSVDEWINKLWHI